MSDCERLSDRMPEVAHQRAAWTADEAAHLASCGDCAAEWTLVLTALRLDARAPTVDAEAIASGLERRLAAARAARRRARWAWVAVPAAAAAAIAIAVSTMGEPVSSPAPQVVAEAEALVPLPELEGLESAQLDTLLQALDGPLAGTPTAESSTLGDEADVELDRIFATWEG